MTARPDREWIAGQLEKLMASADEIAATAPGEMNDYRPLTALKLIVLAAGVDVFSKIVNDRYDHSYYLDLFTGPGATRIRGRDRAIVGSPLLAPVVAHEDFREYHYVEVEEETANALRTRLDRGEELFDIPRDRCYVHHADCNDWVRSFLDDLPGRTGTGFRGVNILTFADPEGLDPEWSVVKRLCDLYGDLIMTFPKTGTSRSLESGKAHQFFGSGDYLDARNEVGRRRVYERQLASCEYTDHTIPIRVDSDQSGGRFHYKMIYATRDTDGGAPYRQAMESMKTKIESLDGGDIGKVMDTLDGDLGALRDVLPAEELVDADQSQSTIGDYP